MYTNDRKFTEILKNAWGIYSKSFLFVIILVLLTFVPVFIFRLFLPEQYFADFQSFVYSFQAFLAGQGAMPTLQLTDGAFIFIALYFGIGLVFYPILVAGSVYLVAAHLESVKPNLDAMFSLIFPKFPRMIITTAAITAFLFFLVIFLGGFLNGILLFIPVLIALNYVFFMQVIADTGRWGINALSLSRFLVRGMGLKVFVVSVVSIVVFIAFSMVTATLANSISTIPTSIAFFIISHIFLAFIPVFFSTWYFDQKRVRMDSLKNIEKILFDTLNEAMENLKKANKDFTNKDKNTMEGEFKEKKAADENQEKDEDK